MRGVCERERRKRHREKGADTESDRQREEVGVSTHTASPLSLNMREAGQRPQCNLGSSWFGARPCVSTPTYNKLLETPQQTGLVPA